MPEYEIFELGDVVLQSGLTLRGYGHLTSGLESENESSESQRLPVV
jgi:hypothetical protein